LWRVVEGGRKSRCPLESREVSSAIKGACVDFLFVEASDAHDQHVAVARAVHSAISRFVSAMAMLNFGGQQMVSTSVQNFVRMTLRKRSLG
jgi:hypothetical protein